MNYEMKNKFALYTSSVGNCFFHEIRDLIFEGFQKLGFDIHISDENNGFNDYVDWHIVLAPHEFFYLGNGNQLRKNKLPENLILINTEQPSTQWFSLSYSLFNRAKFIWDIDYQSAESINKKGFNCSYLPLGYLEHFSLFKEVKQLSENSITRKFSNETKNNSYLNGDWEKRPIDVTFLGSITNRRKNFFDENKALFQNHNCYLDAYYAEKPVITGETTELDETTKIGILQRSKILINIHRGEDIYLEWQRVVMQGIWQKILVISEPCGYSPVITPGVDYIEVPLEKMSETIKYYLETEEGRKKAADIVRNGYENLTNNCKITDYISELVETLNNDGGNEVKKNKRVCFVNNFNPKLGEFPTGYEKYYSFALEAAKNNLDVVMLHTAASTPGDKINYEERLPGITHLALPNQPVLEFEYATNEKIESYLTYYWLKEQKFDVVNLPDWSGIGFYSLLAREQGLAFENTVFILHSILPVYRKIHSDSLFPTSMDLIEANYMEKKCAELSDQIYTPFISNKEWILKHNWKLKNDIIHSKYTGQLNTDKKIKKYKKNVIKEIVFVCKPNDQKSLKIFLNAVSKLTGDLAVRLQFTLVTLTLKAADINWFEQIETSSIVEEVNFEQKYFTDFKVLEKYLEDDSRLIILSFYREIYSYLAEKFINENRPFIVSEPSLAEFKIANFYKRNPNVLAGLIKKIIDYPVPINYEPSSKPLDFSIILDSQKIPYKPKMRQLPQNLGDLPKVSVCLVTRNRTEYLTQALDSLYNQDYKNIELVLVDDGSDSIKHLNYLKDLEKNFLKRDWKIIFQENKYLGAARNTAAKNATGEFLLFMDDDNIAKPYEISTFIKVILRTNSDIVTNLADTFEDSENPFDSNYISKRWLHIGGAQLAGMLKNCFGDANALVRKSAFEKTGGFHEKYGVTHEDWKFFAEAVKIGLKIELIPESLFYYRVSKESMIRTTDIYDNTLQSIEPYLNQFEGINEELIRFTVGINIVNNELIHQARLNKDFLPLNSVINSAKYLVDNKYYDAAYKLLINSFQKINAKMDPTASSIFILDASFLFIKMGKFEEAETFMNVISRNPKLLNKYLLRKRLRELQKLMVSKNNLVIPSTNQTISPKVSIIVPTYNNLKYTLEFINSVVENTQKPYELIIVDNASSDNSVLVFKDLIKENTNIKLISNKENLGFPKAINQGLKEVKGAYIVIANNDVIVTEGWVDRFIGVAESDEKIGIVGPISNSVSGVQFDKEADYKSIEEMHNYAVQIMIKNKGKTLEFPRVAFLCTLIKKEVIEKIGGLDERFSPGNFEDDDFCLRAQLTGFKTVIAKDVFIHHYGSKSFTAEGLEKYKLRLETNQKIFVDKWGATPEEIWLQGKKIKGRNLMFTLDKNEFTENLQRALTLIEQKEYEVALDYLNNSVEQYHNFEHNDSDPELVNLLNLAGNVSLLNGKFETAKKYFENALNEDKNSSKACTGLGEVLFASKNYDAAKTMFEWGVKNDPDDKAALEGLEKVNRILQLPENDNSLYNQNVEQNLVENSNTHNESETDKLIKDAYEMFNEKRYSESLDKLSQVEKIFNGHLSNPSDIEFAASFFNMKGFNYLGLNDIDNAKECFQKAIDINPDSSQVYAGLGEVLFLNEYDEQAKIMFQKALENNPDNLFAVKGLEKINEILSSNSSSAVYRMIPDNKLQINHRDDFGALFNRLGLLGKGVEVGVQAGNYSQTLRSIWKGEELYLIDRWKYSPDYKDIANISDEEQKELYLSVVKKFVNDYSVQVIKKDSNEASKQFPDEFFDWIYLDADHSYEGCTNDLNAWYPKLKKGGVFAGHDYLNGELIGGSFGVKSAVDNFISNKEVNFYLTQENTIRSWYLIKPGDDVSSDVNFKTDEKKFETEEKDNLMGENDNQKLKSVLDEILEASYELFGLKHYDEAIDSLNQSEELFYSQNDKDLISAYENMKGFNYLGLDDKISARQCFETALNINPESSQACAGLGELFFLDGNDKEAKTMYEFAVQNNPENLFAVSGLEKVNKILDYPDTHNTLFNSH